MSISKAVALGLFAAIATGLFVDLFFPGSFPFWGG